MKQVLQKKIGYLQHVQHVELNHTMIFSQVSVLSLCLKVIFDNKFLKVYSLCIYG